jgi:hypothetical protein
MTQFEFSALVMAGLGPAIHALPLIKTGITGTSPVMTPRDAKGN